jgi:hypothetical protein
MAVNTIDTGAVDISINVANRARRAGISLINVSQAGLDAIWDIIDELAFLLGEFIDLVWPVDTGASQADWETTGEGLEWVIRNPREYAAYVHRQGETTLVYKEIADRSEQLLAGAMPRIRAAADAARTTPSRPSLIRQFLLPSIVGPEEAGRGTIFAARVAGFLRENTRSRERARARAR